MNENQFAEYFVIIHKNQIKQDLQIKYLNTDTTVKTIADFIKKHNIMQNIKKQNNIINDEKLYNKILNILKTNNNLEMTPDEYIKHLEHKLHKHSCVE